MATVTTGKPPRAQETSGGQSGDSGKNNQHPVIIGVTILGLATTTTFLGNGYFHQRRRVTAEETTATADTKAGAQAVTAAKVAGAKAVVAAEVVGIQATINAKGFVTTSGKPEITVTGIQDKVAIGELTPATGLPPACIAAVSILIRNPFDGNSLTVEHDIVDGSSGAILAASTATNQQEFEGLEAELKNIPETIC
jgi:hypothetical protein